MLRRAFPDALPASPTLDNLVASGRCGRKSGRGFYDYSGSRKGPDATVYALRASLSEALVQGAEPMQAIEVQERLSLICRNEAARCLDEGIISSARDGDIAAVLGVGFPPFLGGPFRHADALGLSVVCERLQRLEASCGQRYCPASGIGELNENNRRFYAG